ncbi:MAG: peptidyl-prolyl cis-trans isomerase SurA [Sphingomonadales bacterium]|jgi:peptidyl-prolyl cis-trans isomerase SurA|nr:peptidyl-prolyl cis-trans isomerase SurA [Sphingomonadales bacterium]
MKLGRLARAAILLIAPMLSAIAAAQGGGQPARTGALDLPGNVQFVGQQDPGVRKATAIVNGDVITGSDVDHRMALIIASNQIQLPPEEIERFRAQVLRNLIDEAIQIQAAQQQELTIEDREVNQYYDRFAGNFRQTPQAFSAFLRSIGSSERSMKRQIRGELAWQRLQRRNVEIFVTVGDDEVRAVMARLEAQRGTTEYHVAEIFLSATPETAAEVQANVTRIVQQIRAGASFAAYARQYSEATTAAVGGDLGWVQLGQLPPEIDAVLTQMPVGGISEPIANSGGYSIVALVDSRQILVADPRDAQLSLLQMTATLPAGTTPAQAEARAEQLGREAQAMGGCGGAPATAARLHAELISNDTVRVRELPPALQNMLLNLSVGQATPAFGSAERISVLILCGRDDPPAVNAPDFDRTYNDINARRVAARAQRYLRDLRRDAVIDYR